MQDSSRGLLGRPLRVAASFNKALQPTLCSRSHIIDTRHVTEYPLTHDQVFRQ
jgi:hypothetical protein